MIDRGFKLGVLIAWIALADVATAQVTTPATGPSTGRSAALIVVGAPGSPMYARHYVDRARRFKAAMNAAGVREVGVAGPRADDALAALEKAVATVTADDQFVLVMIGHGAANEGSPTLMLPGPDLELKAVAARLNKLKCRGQVVLNFGAAAGDALPLLAATGRVNVAGSMPGQVNDNDFAEFVLQELESKPSAPLLDVYNRATERFAKWIVRQRQATGEGATGWIVEGKDSAATFSKLYGEADVPPERRFTPSPESDAPDDPNPPLIPDAKPAWAMRRVLTEMPAVDDVGKGAPVTALTEKGFAPVVPGKESPAGTVASKTVLGRTNP